MPVRPAPEIHRTPPEDLVRSVSEAYEAGQVLEAFRRAEAFAPIGLWAGADACVVAARLAENLGAPRLAVCLTLRARASDPRHAQALIRYGCEVLRRRGPLATWERLKQERECEEAAGTEDRAELMALKGLSASFLRDFATAEDLLSKAESLCPKNAWVRAQRANLLECLDRIEEALEVARSSLSLHPYPYYRLGIQLCAHYLQLLDRDEEAIRLLEEANCALESGPVAAQLYSLLSENGRWTEADEALERYAKLSPLLERSLREWWTAQKARVAYRMGRRADAAQLAAELDDAFHKKFAQRLREPPAERERVQLAVSFVRQHFKTCAPATLAAIGRFWGMPAEHLKLVEAICYDGTPAWQQRQWAERNGWYVREFRVTHDAAVSLIERGVPFAISVVEATSAHMMAVIGFDRTGDTLLLRDPGQPYVVEVDAQGFLERHRPFGPRGAVFLPLAERGRLDGLELPDAAVYDEYHRLWLALASHDRAGAGEILRRMEASFPEHELLWEARLEVATYDANAAEEIRCLRKLLELFPDNAPRTLRLYASLREATREERIEFLRGACASERADPALFVELADALGDDARSLPEAQRWLRRALRFRQLDARAISVRAKLFEEEGKPEEAAELLRFAANLEEFREHLYKQWFNASRCIRRTEEAMAHLEDRFARFGRRSAQPALTLAWAWGELERPDRARAVLAEAAKLRPEDGSLMLGAATLLAGFGGYEEAEKLLAGAEGKVRKNDWVRAAAEIAESRLDAQAILRWVRELLELEPLALDAHARLVRALARLEGPAAALEHLKGACAQFPNHYGLRRMLVEWSRERGPEAIQEAARDLLRVAPSDAWARRELALSLARAGRSEEALREATEAAAIEPRNSFSFSVLGYLYSRLQRRIEAREQFRKAVELSADNEGALHALVELAQTDEERKEELAFVEGELIRQVVLGNGLLAFVELARPVLDPRALLRSLVRIHSERPDLWHAWSALISQHGHLGHLDEALRLATEATKRFPHLPAAWLDLAHVHRWRDEATPEISAAERAFEMNPSWNPAALALADVYERQGRLDDALRVYDRALQHVPRDPEIRASKAHVLWRLGERQEAIAEVERALRLAPDYPWAWALLKDWAEDCGEPKRTSAFARELARERPGEVRVWLTLARALSDPADLAERLDAIERALRLDPRSTEAWDLKAECLADADRFEEALRACEEGERMCAVDVAELRGRRAWIEARRGRLSEAIQQMREVLAENAGYAWGWNRLAEWLAEEGSREEAVAALERLLRLRPHDPWVHSRLGALRLEKGDRGGAREALREALRLDPSNTVAAHNLFELELQDDDVRGATETLRLMQTHQPWAATVTAEILLHLHRGEDAAAIAAFERLCAKLDPNPWPLDRATAALDRAGRSGEALRILKRALQGRGPCNPEAGAAAIKLLAGRKKLGAAVRLFERLPAGEIQRRAAFPLLETLIRRKAKGVLRRILKASRDALAADDAVWGQVGHALISLGQLGEAARWMADWRSRSRVEPWMLFNYCLALRHLARYEEASAVARWASENLENREGSADLRLFLAVEEALAGAVEAAEEHLRRLSARNDVPYDQQMLSLAKALVDFERKPISDRAWAFRNIRRQLAKRFRVFGMLGVGKDLRRTFRRAGAVFARDGAGWRARLWFGWRLYWQWSPLALFLSLRALHAILAALVR